MTVHQFLANLTIILSVMAIGATLEILVPMFVDKPWKRDRRAANLGLTALSFASNWMLASAAAVAALTLRPAGLLAQRGLPFWAEVLIGILVLDFSVGYLSHRHDAHLAIHVEIPRSPPQRSVRGRDDHV